MAGRAQADLARGSLRNPPGRSTAPTASYKTAISPRRFCAPAHRSGIAQACRCHICGRSLAPTTSTVATRRPASGRTRRSWPRTTGLASCGDGTSTGRLRAHARRQVSFQPAATGAVGQPASDARRARVRQRLPAGCRTRLADDWNRGRRRLDRSPISATTRRPGSADTASGGGRSGPASSSRACFASIPTTSSGRPGIRRSVQDGGLHRLFDFAGRSHGHSVCPPSPSGTTRSRQPGSGGCGAGDLVNWRSRCRRTRWWRLVAADQPLRTPGPRCHRLASPDCGRPMADLQRAGSHYAWVRSRCPEGALVQQLRAPAVRRLTSTRRRSTSCRSMCSIMLRIR